MHGVFKTFAFDCELRKGNMCLLMKTAVSKTDFFQSDQWKKKENNNISSDNEGDNDDNADNDKEWEKYGLGISGPRCRNENLVLE